MIAPTSLPFPSRPRRPRRPCFCRAEEAAATATTAVVVVPKTKAFGVGRAAALIIARAGVGVVRSSASQQTLIKL